MNRSAYRYQRNVGLWWNSYAYDTEYYPILLIGHQQPGGPMTLKGNAYGGYAGDGQLTFASGTRLRQVVKIPDHPGWAGRTMRSVDVSLWRWNASSTGSVSLVLRRAVSTPGAATDKGTILAQTSITASSLYNAAGNIKFDIPKTYEPRQTLTLPANLTVQPGQAYYIEPAPRSGSAVYAVGRVLNYLRASRGLLKPDHQDSTCVHSRRSAPAAGPRSPTMSARATICIWASACTSTPDRTLPQPRQSQARRPVSGPVGRTCGGACHPQPLGRHAIN